MDAEFTILVSGINLRTIHRVALADDPLPHGRREVLVFGYGEIDPVRFALTEDKAFAMTEQLAVAANEARMSAAPVLPPSDDGDDSASG